MSYEERISDEQLDHLIRMQDMLRCRMAGVLASDDGFHEGNVHAGTYRALVELKRLRRELAEARAWINEAGHHESCGWLEGKAVGRCTCGLDAFLTRTDQPPVVQHKRGCAYLVDAAYKVPSPCTCGASDKS